MRKETKKSSFAKASEDKENKKETEDAEGEISLEDIPFVGGLLKGLGKFIDLAERAEKVGGELKRSGHIKGLGGHKDIRGVYGFTVRTGIGQKTKIEHFGNIKRTKTGPKVAETREPIVDVFDEKDHILIIAELPGIDEKSIKLDLKKPARSADGGMLLLEAESKDRKYAKEILLPAKVDFDSRKMNFKNGIFEVKLKKS